MGLLDEYTHHDSGHICTLSLVHSQVNHPGTLEGRVLLKSLTNKLSRSIWTCTAIVFSLNALHTWNRMVRFFFLKFDFNLASAATGNRPIPIPDGLPCGLLPQSGICIHRCECGYHHIFLKSKLSDKSGRRKTNTENVDNQCASDQVNQKKYRCETG